ncbi:MAG: EthD family reductase [Candidatus Sericytochromatia bacterium]|nr:EthD family reductase [Candidatus Tanganyikabacteria bacterium]
MVRVTVAYPAKEGATFDHDYYATKHMPLCAEKYAPYLKKMQAFKGVAGPAGSPAPFLATCHFWFDSMGDMGKALANSEAIMADIPNYTSVQPRVVIEEALPLAVTVG